MQEIDQPPKPAAKKSQLIQGFSSDPQGAAQSLLSVRDEAWVDDFLSSLLDARSAQSLSAALAAWDLNQSEAAELFGVSRQAMAKWLKQGVPGDRQRQVGDFLSATKVLNHYLKPTSIPAVVRRAAPSLGGKSLIECFARDTAKALNLCRAMFDVAAAHS